MIECLCAFSTKRLPSAKKARALSSIETNDLFFNMFDTIWAAQNICSSAFRNQYTPAIFRNKLTISLVFEIVTEKKGKTYEIYLYK